MIHHDSMRFSHDNSSPFSKAVESLCGIASVLSPTQVELYFIPLVKRLTSGEWFTSRISASGLYAAAYPKSNPSLQTELRR